jgi:hypothetical protein
MSVTRPKSLPNRYQIQSRSGNSMNFVDFPESSPGGRQKVKLDLPMTEKVMFVNSNFNPIYYL